MQEPECRPPHSIQGREPETVEALARWVADEYRNKRGEEVDTSSWPRRYEADIPEQHNGWDCGVFTLQASPQHQRPRSFKGSQQLLECA
jgi:sentrin-specific protease 1